MSIIPYNSTSEIVYHDPHDGILVVHNNQQNSFQLLSTVSNPSVDTSHHQFHSKDPRFRPPQGPDSHQCPNCGFSWSEIKAETRRSFDDNVPPADEVPDDGLIPQTFMHSDYFKLLAKLPYTKPRVICGDGTESLPQSIFNQGYFDRFFKKIPPYVLGSGAHAQVYKVTHVLNSIELGTYAVKRISIGDHSEFLDQVLNEVLILYELSIQGANENNLIRYNHVWLELGDINDLQTFFLPQGTIPQSVLNRIPYVFILQQYCAGGHLEDLVSKVYQKSKNMSLSERIHEEKIKRRKRRSSNEQNEKRNSINEQNERKKSWLSDVEIWKFFHDIATGVHYLHSHGILHRDLKPSNCLLDVVYVNDKFSLGEESFTSLAEFNEYLHKLPKVLVSDFGEGKFINKHCVSHKTFSEERQGNTGTLEFTAPELWLYAKYDPSNRPGKQRFVYSSTYKSDIYSLGLILCWLCVGSLPFSEAIASDSDPEKVRTIIAKWYTNFTSEGFHHWFTNLVRETRGEEPSEPLLDLEKLVYMMLKGRSEEKEVPERTSSLHVLKCLDAIKWNRFIGKRRGSSVDEIPPVDESDDEVDPDVIDALALAKQCHLSIDAVALADQPRSQLAASVKGRRVPDNTFIVAYLAYYIVLDYFGFSFGVKLISVIACVFHLLAPLPSGSELVLLSVTTLAVLSLLLHSHLT